MSEIYEYVEELCKSAKEAGRKFSSLSGGERNSLLMLCAEKIEKSRDEILAANETDMNNAKENGVRDTMLDRLRLTEERIAAIAGAMRDVAALPDVCGMGERFVRPNGLVIDKIRVPLGVVAMIYEARPNVTADAAALCMKTGNACVLRCGKEAVNSSRAIVSAMKEALREKNINENVVSFLDSTSREGSNALMQMKGYVDVLIPRGGKGLIKSVVENAKVPVIETGAGNCHLYIDENADYEMAVKVAVNAKTSRPSVCNAIETILVHKSSADIIPLLAEGMKKWNVEFRGDSETKKYIDCVNATEEDYETEFDDYIVAVKVVDNIDEAIGHINRYGTGHSECIITNDVKNAAKFQREVDAACVYVNASTRFTDGGCFGFGAEIGISTQKLHARGPMALRELTTDKYLICGEGQIR